MKINNSPLHKETITIVKYKEELHKNQHLRCDLLLLPTCLFTQDESQCFLSNDDCLHFLSAFNHFCWQNLLPKEETMCTVQAWIAIIHVVSQHKTMFVLKNNAKWNIFLMYESSCMKGYFYLVGLKIIFGKIFE